MIKSKKLPVQALMCATCPWREDSPYSILKSDLTKSAITERSRICHCTGSNSLNRRTGKPERLCRGARNEQLQFFHRIGFIEAPTDEAWDKKCKEMGIE